MQYQMNASMGVNNLLERNEAHISHNVDITHLDESLNMETLVLRCSCTISAGTSISYYITVEDEETYVANKTEIDKKIAEYKQSISELATKYNVPFML